MKRRFNLLVLLLWVAAVSGGAQSNLYVSAGTNMLIKAGTEVSVGGLVLTPVADFTIRGANNIVRTVTISHPSANPYISRVYQLANTLSGYSGRITIYYRDEELNGLSERTLTLNIHDGERWIDYPASVTRDGAANFVSVTRLSDLSLNELTLAAEATPLPLRFLQVEATGQNDRTHIKWVTADESNCASFQVEKSADAVHWSRVGSPVAARNTAGPNYYSATDIAPDGVVYYRIREDDADGVYFYSKIVSVSGAAPAIRIYPNPVGSFLYVQGLSSRTAFATAAIFDQKGREIRKTVVSPANPSIPVGGLPAGIYWIKIEGGNRQFMAKFVKGG